MAGQTQSEIRSLLAAAGLTPQHRYGQNFLVDLNLMRKLVEYGAVGPADTVLEVGPGTGSLSELLLARGARLVAVEIDRGLQGVLRDRFAAEPRFTLIQGDALATKHQVNPLILKVLAEQPPAAGGHYRLVANLPYAIATPLLVDLLMVTPAFEQLTCTIQKEVGERLVAAANEEAYGPVSVVMQLAADVQLHAIVPPTAFWPRPQVESAMLTIRPRAAAELPRADWPDFAAFVRGAFSQRRKMLRRIFRMWDTLQQSEAFGRAGVTPESRPEALSPAAWLRLYRARPQPDR